jgi:phosphoribosyl 1,2-cyclic phosphate phosphodiesterase
MGVRGVELVILGSGTSSGVPVIGCECAVCTSSDPRDRRTRPAACLRFLDSEDRPRTILIDTSPDLREQALRERLARCDAIVYTHSHVDHTFGLDEVRRFNALMKASIDLYADAETLEFLRRVYRHIFDPQANVNDSFVARLIPHLVEPLRPFDLLGLRWTPLRLLHGRVPILGFRIEALDEEGRVSDAQPSPLPLAYCTDVSAVPPETWPRLRGLQTLVLDMLRYRKHPTHMSVDEAIETAGRIGAGRTFFIHMTHDVSHACLEAQLPPTMALCYDGLVVA